MKLLAPSFLALCLGFASAEIKPLVELDLPQISPDQRIYNQGWRMTVQPGEGQFVIAYLQEFGDVESPGNDTEPRRETKRLIWTAGASVSEDVIWTSYLKGPRMKATDPHSTLSILSALGQRIELKGMFLKKSGSSSNLQRLRRRFGFSDFPNEPQKWQTFYIGMEVIDAVEARQLAVLAGVALPEKDSGPWSVTLPPRVDEIPALAGEAAAKEDGKSLPEKP